MSISKIKTILLTSFKILVPAIFLTAAIAELIIKQYVDSGILLFGFACVAYRNYKPGSYSVGSLIFYNCWCLLLAGYFVYKNYSRYMKEVYAHTFGLPLNDIRRKADAPIIPSDWLQHPYPDREINWGPKIESFGHISKLIFLDSLSRYIEWEEDTYKLKKPGKDTSYIMIRVYYNDQKKADSAFYRFECGMDNKNISRQQADSIFKAERIQKDY